MKQNKEQNYTEAELVLNLTLDKIKLTHTPTMATWLDAQVILNPSEQILFEKLWLRAKKDIESWQEEELKVKFIAPLLELCDLIDGQGYETYLEKTISATVDGYFLKTKADFMISKGIMDKPLRPYFHVQEWKPHKKPTGDSMAQLLEGMLIAQALNEDGLPIYGCEVVGKQWSFTVLEGKQYCTSESFNVTKKDELLQVIAILKKFREILITKLLR
jgi:hypothetical protein